MLNTPPISPGSTFVLGQQFTPQTKTDANTAEGILFSLPIPANTLGPNDSLRIHCRWSMTNGATTKNLAIRIDGSNIRFYTATTSSFAVDQSLLSNRNSQQAQVGMAVGSNVSLGTSGAAISTHAFDFTQDTLLEVVGFHSVAGAGNVNLTLEAVLVEVIRAA